MTKKRENSPLTDEVFVILAQIFGAFGYGAGGLTVEPGVVRLATSDYVRVIRMNANNWATFEVAVLESARLTGRLAAQSALNARRLRINESDYVRAVRRVVLGCPFRHPHS